MEGKDRSTDRQTGDAPQRITQNYYIAIIYGSHSHVKADEIPVPLPFPLQRGLRGRGYQRESS